MVKQTENASEVVSEIVEIGTALELERDDPRAWVALTAQVFQEAIAKELEARQMLRSTDSR